MYLFAKEVRGSNSSGGSNPPVSANWENANVKRSAEWRETRRSARIWKGFFGEKEKDLSIKGKRNFFIKTMNQKGFINIILIIIVVALVGVGVYFVSTKQITLPIPSPIPSPTPTPTPSPFPTPTPVQPPQSNNVLSVLDLTGNREVYVGKRVRVQGKIAVNVFYGEMPCPTDGSVCDTTMGAQLELRQPEGSYILLFKKGNPYPCQKIAPETYTCSPYINGQIITVEGVWSKDQVPVQWVGTSGGNPPTPVKWGDRYFLNIE